MNYWKQISVYVVCLLLMGLLCPKALAQSPPTIFVYGGVTSTVPSADPWGLTITPAPVGGTNNELFTTNTFEDDDYEYGGDPTSWAATGYLTLLAGHQYTFQLSTYYGGGWGIDSTTGEVLYNDSYYTITFYDGTSSNPPNWIASSNNPPLNRAPVTLETFAALAFTFQVYPQITATTVYTFNKVNVTTSVLYGVKFKGANRPLSVNLNVWTYPNGAISSVSSSRGGIDVITPTKGNADKVVGGFHAALTTSTPFPSANVTCGLTSAQNTPLAIGPFPLNILPAVFDTPFYCSIYYTPIEAGFTAANGFDVAPMSASGTGMDFEADFVKAVHEEGYGHLKNPVNGMNYLMWNDTTMTYSFAARPEGIGSVPLVAKYSCAIKRKALPTTGQITTIDTSIAAAFGTESWGVADVGDLEENQLDLYYGEDNPRPASGTAKKRPARPASTTFDNAYSVPVILNNF